MVFLFTTRSFIVDVFLIAAPSQYIVDINWFYLVTVRHTEEKNERKNRMRRHEKYKKESRCGLNEIQSRSLGVLFCFKQHHRVRKYISTNIKYMYANAIECVLSRRERFALDINLKGMN